MSPSSQLHAFTPIKSLLYIVLGCLVDWMIALSHSNKGKKTHIGHFYTYSFYTGMELSTLWKIHTFTFTCIHLADALIQSDFQERALHTQPQQLGTSSSCWSPAWSHTAVGWHPFPQPGFVTRQPTCLHWSLWHVQHAQADWSSKWEWIPTEEYCRGFWQKKLVRYPHG